MSAVCLNIDDFVKEVRIQIEDERRTSPLDEGAEFYFRGESNNHCSDPNSQPSTVINCSLDRRDPKKERELYQEALRRNVASFDADKTMVEQLARMQHYQLPTRFFDLSDNALQSLYFACGGGSFTKDDDANRDGFVRIFKIAKEKIKSFTSDIIIGISHLPLVDAGRVYPSQAKGLDGLAYEIKQHRPGFYTEENWPEIGDYFRKEMQQVWAFKPILNNERIRVQSGLFLAYGCRDEKSPLRPDFSPKNYMDKTKPSWGIKQIAAVRIVSFAKKTSLNNCGCLVSMLKPFTPIYQMFVRKSTDVYFTKTRRITMAKALKNEQYYIEGEIGTLTINIPARGMLPSTFELYPDSKFRIQDKDGKDKLFFIEAHGDFAKLLESDVCKKFTIRGPKSVDSNLLLQAKNFHNRVRVYSNNPQPSVIPCTKIEFI